MRSELGRRIAVTLGAAPLVCRIGSYARLPGTVASEGAGRWSWTAAAPRRGLRIVPCVLAIIGCTFVSPALGIVPSQAAKRRSRGIVPDVAPGEATATQRDDVITRATVLGAASFLGSWSRTPRHRCRSAARRGWFWRVPSWMSTPRCGARLLSSS